MRQNPIRPQPIETAPSPTTGYLSAWLFALCLILGLTLGIGFTRAYGPWQRANAEPWQLHPEDRAHYMMAIALEYAHNGDTAKALDKLIALKPPGDPLTQLAQTACSLASRGYLGSPSGIQALRGAVALYAPQNRLYIAQGEQTDCAQQRLPTLNTAIPPQTNLAPAPQTQRPTPLPTKRPLQDQLLATPTPRYRAALPTPPSFELLSVRSFCDLNRPALIEVFIVDYLGRGIPGQRIRVRWGDQEDIFLSGLKAERGQAYADFQMRENIDYAIDMLGADDSLGAPLNTDPCYTENRRSLKSYRVTFVQR